MKLVQRAAENSFFYCHCKYIHKADVVVFLTRVNAFVRPSTWTRRLVIISGSVWTASVRAPITILSTALRCDKQFDVLEEEVSIASACCKQRV